MPIQSAKTLYLLILLSLPHIPQVQSSPTSKPDPSPDTIFSSKLTRDLSSSPYPNPSCNPSSFGITKSKDDRYFPSKHSYFNCSSSSHFSTSISQDSLIHTCESSPYFISNTVHELFGRYSQSYTWSKYSNISINSSEWFIIKCQKSRSVILRNLFNSTAFNRAKLKIQELINKKGLKTFRPLTVLMVVLDSVSRQSFYRNLEGTVDWLNLNLVQNNSKFFNDFVIYDFLLNNVQGEKTTENLAGLIYGMQIEEIWDYFNEHSIHDERDWPVFKSLQEKKAIWKQFERQGFVTLFSYDSYTDYVSKFLGREILTDHVNCNFWRAGNYFAGFEDFTEGSQCVGDKTPHNLTFNYLTDYVNNYWGVNRFAYAHISLAHESSGRRLSTMDSDLRLFLSSLLGQFSSHPEEDLVLLLCSDHGRMPLVTSRESWQEKLLPVHLLITSKSISSKAAVHETLKQNSLRLTTREDWHKSLIFLSHFPYLPDFSLNSSEDFSLFTQLLSLNRTCQEAKIPSIWCSCLERKNEIFDLMNNEEVLALADKSVEAVNKFLYKYGMIEYCEPIARGKIRQGFEVYIKEKDLFGLKSIEFVLADKDDEGFEVVVKALTGKKKGFQLVQDNYGLKPVIEKSFVSQRNEEVEVLAQVLSIENKDLNHSCLLLPDEFDMVKGLCKCRRVRSYKVFLLESPQESCLEFCGKEKGICEDFEHVYKNLDSVLRIVKKFYGEFDRFRKGKVFEMVGNDLVLPVGNYCGVFPINIQKLICICSFINS